MTIREHYSHAIADNKKKERRKDAEARQTLRNQRTPKQQLKKLDIEGRIAKKERKRLEKMI
ncbi:unnamed protein product [marine sediment metagenome]|uniref:Uncharacterized protein n=1 Tax=marine sediment metagenome TaxID=412755 RepID=X0V892_9ZZZZ